MLYLGRMKILIVEDNEELSSTLVTFLSTEGYVCQTASSYAEAVERLSGFNYDSIILDLMLPDRSGLQVLEWIKASRLDCTVLIVSAKNALDDRIKGLENGADDYLTKPFHLTELNARLKAIHRRKKMNGETIVSWKELSVNTNTMEARVHDILLDLTKKEYDLLVYFMINKDRVLTRQSIAEHLWGDYTDSLGNVDFVYQHIKNLRKKIDLAGGGDYITNMYGLGYKFSTAP